MLLACSQAILISLCNCCCCRLLCASAQCPVWISITGAPVRLAASICFKSASMNNDTFMPASASCRQASVIFDSYRITSRPPSVVNSSRFSGTRQQSSGFTSQAMLSISSVTAISRFIRVSIRSFSKQTSLSWIWRRSSRKCKVILSAPACSTSKAAYTGSGYRVPLACLRVATWSILTPKSNSFAFT